MERDESQAFQQMDFSAVCNTGTESITADFLLSCCQSSSWRRLKAVASVIQGEVEGVGIFIPEKKRLRGVELSV